jgi:broad specificity phosphatase PhoE
MGEILMETTILLIRHGQTDGNVNGHYTGWSQEDLNSTGYKQAQLLSNRLTHTQIDAIYTSPLKRTRTTAETVAKPHNLELTTMDDLIEINLGDWQGLQAKEIGQKWPDMWKQSRIDPSGLTWPNGESFAQVARRGASAFEQVAQQNIGKCVAIVTHDIIIRIMVAHVLGVSNSIYRRMEIGNTSITQIRIIDNQPRQVIKMNDASHLDDMS